MRERGPHDLHALLVDGRAGQVSAAWSGPATGWSWRRRARVSEDGGQVRATARVDGQLAAEAELTFAFAEVKHPKLVERRREVLNVWLHGSTRSRDGRRARHGRGRRRRGRRSRVRPRRRRGHAARPRLAVVARGAGRGARARSRR